MTTVTPKLFSVAEYHRLIELGFFQEDERIELIRGQIIQMAAKGTPHSVCNTLLFGELFTLLQGQATIRNQEPIILSDDSEPEPDIVIVRNRSDRYWRSKVGVVPRTCDKIRSGPTDSYKGGPIIFEVRPWVLSRIVSCFLCIGVKVDALT